MPLFGSDPRDSWKEELEDLAAEFEHYRLEDATRLDRARQYREEIEATRDLKRRMMFDETSDYGRKRQRATNQTLSRHSFRFPLAQALTVKHAYRIAGRMPDAVVEKREENAAERWRSQMMEQIWWGVTNASQGDQQFADAAWDASQIGAAGFDLYLDPSLQPLVPRYCALDTGSVVVVPGLADPHEFQRVYRWWTVPVRSFRMAYKDRSFRDTDIRVGDINPSNDNTPMVTIVECCDKQRKIRFALNANPGATPMGLEEWSHNYGFVPTVIIPNIGPYRRIWGWADYDFVREITHYIQQFFAQHADILRAVANGSYVLKGSKASPAQVKQLLEVGGVIPIGREGELTPVEAPEVPAFTADHISLSMDLFERLGFAPPAAWGAIGAQSGSDRGLQLQPLQELTTMKQKNFEAGLSRMGAMMFKIIEQVDSPKASYKGTQTKGAKKTTFSILVGSQVPPEPVETSFEEGSLVEMPRTPKEIFDGDYLISFEFADRIDYDDPAYVASELNKYAQAVQSLQTTLERLGIERPEDEIKLIAAEAEQYPWMRQGMIKLIEQQLGASQQGEGGGGSEVDPAAAMAGMQDTMGQGTAALDADAGIGALGAGGAPPGVGVPYGGA